MNTTRFPYPHDSSAPASSPPARRGLDRPSRLYPRAGILIIVALTAVALALTGCVTGPGASPPVIEKTSPVAVVGQDLTKAAATATKAWADYKAGNVDYAWAVATALHAYRDIVKTSADVKTLIAQWTGSRGQSYAERIALLFSSSSGTPPEKMAALAKAVETAAAEASR